MILPVFGKPRLWRDPSRGKSQRARLDSDLAGHVKDVSLSLCVTSTNNTGCLPRWF